LSVLHVGKGRYAWDRQIEDRRAWAECVRLPCRITLTNV